MSIDVLVTKIEVDIWGRFDMSVTWDKKNLDISYYEEALVFIELKRIVNWTFS